MKRFVKMFIILCFSMLTTDVNAEMCDIEDVMRLETIASNISLNSEHVLTTNNEGTFSSYKVDIIGISEDIYIVDELNMKHYYEDCEDGVISLATNYGVKKYEIRSRYCADLLLDTKSITLKEFNYYSLSDECQEEQFKELEVCDEWYQGNISYSDFQSIIDEARIEEKKLDKRIIIGIAVVFIILVILLIVKERKRWLLE